LKEAEEKEGWVVVEVLLEKRFIKTIVFLNQPTLHSYLRSSWRAVGPYRMLKILAAARKKK
jgi:hypothetical protein